MNNSNAASLLARLRPGDFVTIRLPDGSTQYGRAYRNPIAGWHLATLNASTGPAVTPDNIVSITRDLS